MVDYVLLERDEDLGKMATPKSTKSVNSEAFKRMLTKGMDDESMKKNKKKNTQPIEIAIRELADAFAITEENAGIEFFIRL